MLSKGDERGNNYALGRFVGWQLSRLKEEGLVEVLKRVDLKSTPTSRIYVTEAGMAYIAAH